MPTLHELKKFAQYHLVRRVHDHPAREDELGVVSLDYDAVRFAAEVRALADRFEVREAAHVAYAGRPHTIFSIGTRNLARAKARLLVLSGVHGNEHAGIVCVPEIAARLEAEAAALADVAVQILTPVNPVGAAELSRLNGEGYDVNRDFVLFLTPEARAVREAFDAFRPNFVVSLHEGPQDAAFMFANEHVERALADRLLAALERSGTTLADKDYFGTTLRPRGLSPSSPASRALMRVWAATLKMMPTSEYAARRGLPELTLESGWRSPDREARVRPHVELVLAVAHALARQA
ncbi:MAG: DUF2817 domain-containing protein [Sandaracinaceae bacterium]|nr:DUF2817 domain-containing protein [Sandaracinaceae bacterium]